MLETLTACLVLVLPQGDKTAPTKVETGDGLEFRTLSTRRLTLELENHAIPTLGPMLAGRLSFRESPAPEYLRLGSVGAPFERGNWGPEMGWFFHEERRRIITANDFVELLTERIDPSSWEERGSIDIRPGALDVVQTPEALQRATALLRGLGCALAPRLEIEVVLFDRGRVASPRLRDAMGFAKLDDAAADALETLIEGSRTALLHRQRFELVPRSAVHAGRDAPRGYVADSNTEVATESAASDPQVERFVNGLGISLVPLLQPNGQDLALFGMLTKREADSPRLLEVDAKHTESLDQISCQETQVTFSLAMTGKGAFLLVPGGFRHTEIAVFVRVVRVEEPQEELDFEVLPHSLLTSTLMTRVLEKWPEEKRKPQRGTAPIDQEWLREMVERLSPDGWESEEAFVHDLGEAILVRASPEVRARTRTLLSYLARNRRRTFVVQLQREARPQNEHGDWQPLGPPQTLSVLGHRQGSFVQGESGTYVRDFNVEIAQGAAVYDPVIGAYFVGTQLVATVHPEESDCLVTLTLVDSTKDGSRQMSSRGLDSGRLETPEINCVRLHRNLRMRPGESRVLGWGTVRKVEGRPHDTRLKVRLEEL